MDYRFIAVEGNIGSGKTTLAKLIASHFGASLLLEKFEKNEFLPKFYASPKRYAFPLELSFLAERFQQLKGIHNGTDLFQSLTIADYFLSKSLVFARTNLADDEYKLFWQLFHIMFQSIPKPDLLIYLYTPVPRLLENIKKRGRDYEQNIDDLYLERIQRQYIEFLTKNADHLKVLIVNMEHGDFVKNPDHLQCIIDEIGKEYVNGIHHLEI